MDVRARLRAADRRTATAPGGVDTAYAAAEDSARELLLAQLGSPDRIVRSSVAIALGRSETVRALPDLVRLSDPRAGNVRRSAGLGLGLLGDRLASDDLAGVLLNPREEESLRAVAALSLGMLGGERAAGTLLRILDSSEDASPVADVGRSASLRETTVVALGLSGNRPAALRLRRILADPHEEVRVRAFAAASLARLGDRDSLPLLGQALRSDSETIRRSAAIALGTLSRPEDAWVADLVRAATGDRDPSVRRSAVLSLGRVGGVAATGALRGLFGRARHDDLPFTVLALGLARDAGSVPALRWAFRTADDPELRGAAAVALGLVADLGSGPDLLAVASAKGDQRLRGYCFQAMGMMRYLPAAEVARDVLARERGSADLEPAAACLALLGHRAVLGSLVHLVREGCCPYHRGIAVRALGTVGDASALPALLSLVRDPAEPKRLRIRAVASLGAVLDSNDVPRLDAVGRDSDFLLFRGVLKSVVVP